MRHTGSLLPGQKRRLVRSRVTGCVSVRSVNKKPPLVIQDNKSLKLHKRYSFYKAYYHKEQLKKSHLSHDQR